MGTKDFSYTRLTIDDQRIDYTRCHDFEKPMKLMNVVMGIAMISMFAIYMIQNSGG